MGMKLTELEADSKITLVISANDNKMEMPGTIKKVVNKDVAIIDIEYETEKRLNFNNVKVEMECNVDDGVPFWWKDTRIITYKGEYVLQVACEGKRHNRRQSFRVPVSRYGYMQLPSRGNTKVMVRDVSISGFAIADRSKEYNLEKGFTGTLKFEENGYSLELVGLLVRKEEREDMDMYGFSIQNLCKDLGPYISFKQRHKD